MNNYSNPMVTYDEVVDAIKAIIDCSKANGYLDDYGFLNVKYDSLNKNPIREEQEKLLVNALQSLEKTIDATNKVIRENLEKELAELETDDVVVIYAEYEHGEERRKLASQKDLVMRLKEMSLPIEVLFNPNDDVECLEELPDGLEEITDEEIEPTEEIVEDLADEEFTEEENFDDNEEYVEEVEEKKASVQKEANKTNIDKIKLIKKALDKAREKDNEQLVKILEQQLRKEIENIK